MWVTCIGVVYVTSTLPLPSFDSDDYRGQLIE